MIPADKEHFVLRHVDGQSAMGEAMRGDGSRFIKLIYPYGMLGVPEIWP